MRILILIVTAVSLMLLGGKCDKPKVPKEQAVDAVEEAWLTVDVAPQLDEALEVVVEVDSAVVDEGIAVVHFTRLGAQTEAAVVIAGERFVFVVTSDGEVADEPPLREATR